VSPDDENEQWFFETVEDNGQCIAIRQLAVESDGTRHAYSPERLEDDHGFLTDQPVRPAEWGFNAISREAWDAAWG
jgi:hypothetical protein